MLPDEVRKAVEVSRSPRVDALIERVMQKHPGFGVSAQARYYEAVHQELAPLSRDLEARAERAEALLRECDEVARKRGDKYGLCDAIDNTGQPYQSQFLADYLAHLSENSRG